MSLENITRAFEEIKNKTNLIDEMQKLRMDNVDLKIEIVKLLNRNKELEIENKKLNEELNIIKKKSEDEMKLRDQYNAIYNRYSKINMLD